VLFTLRVEALFRGVRWFKWLLWITFTIFQGMRSGILLFGDAVIYSELTVKQRTSQLTSHYAVGIKYSPKSNLCIVGSMKYRPTALIGVPTIFDSLLLVLTALKAIRSPASIKKDSIVCMNL
jgi:hypothetical protein